jgi:hypothetical protein
MRAKREEEPDDNKFDYLTLLVNTTKKYSNNYGRRGTGVTVAPFRPSLTKKNTIQSSAMK